MPELPEVQTTVNILNQKIKGLSLLGVWTDYDSAFHKGKNNIKDKNYFPFFKKQILNKKILGVERRAKNVLINVSGNHTILVHLKMTGHLLYGKYKFDNLPMSRAGKKWLPVDDGPLSDPYNRFIHLAFSLSNGNTLVLSDARKFAKVYVFDTDKTYQTHDLEKLGPEPLEKSFTYKNFKETLYKKPNLPEKILTDGKSKIFRALDKKSNASVKTLTGGKIKTVLMDQEIISGIGNIYSDEILWMSSIHPLSKVKDIDERFLKIIYKNIIKVLNESIKVGGDSMSDYRNPMGEKGGYQNIHKVYRKTGEKCKRKNCGGTIQRIKVGGRSAHYCDKHQKLYQK